MVKKIKKVKRVPKAARVVGRNWLVAFDAEGQAGLFIHKHGDSDDHSNCGPVVMCCERAVEPYRKLTPDLHQRVDRYQVQGAPHLCSWIDGGVGAMYFVLCDEADPDVIYQFGLDPARAKSFLMGAQPLNAYRLPDVRFSAAEL